MKEVHVYANPPSITRLFAIKSSVRHGNVWPSILLIWLPLLFRWLHLALHPGRSSKTLLHATEVRNEEGHSRASS